MSKQKILAEFEDDQLIAGLAAIWPAFGRDWLAEVVRLLGGSAASFDELLFASLEDLQDRVAKYWGTFLRSEVSKVLEELPSEAGPGEFAAALSGYVMSHIPVVISTEVKNTSEELTQGLLIRSSITQKQWLSRQDARVRSDHRTLNGQIREVGKPYEIRGLKAMRPGGFGRADQDIGCRCLSVPYRGALATPAIWRSLDAKLLNWEAQATIVLRGSVQESIRSALKHL